MASTRLTYRQVKLAILGALEDDGPLPAEKLLSTPLARELDRDIRERERLLAEEALEHLLADEMISGEAEVLRLTERGLQARARGCLDPLDRALNALDPALVERRAAAWAAVASARPDDLRAAAEGPRRIVDAVLGAVSRPGLPAAVRAAVDLVLAIDRTMEERAAKGQMRAQDLADAIRVTEIIVRRLLIDGDDGSAQEGARAGDG